MVKVEWSVFARADLRQVYDYLFDVAGERTARKIIGKIQARTEILSRNPRAGQKEEIVEDHDREFRYLVEGNYKIVYWLETDCATISTIFDCRQNPQKMKEEVYNNKL